MLYKQGAVNLLENGTPEHLSPFVRAWGIVLQQLPSKGVRNAVEICCGTLPKVGLAFDAVVEAQNVYYIDSTPSSLEQCVSIAQAHTLHATVHAMTTKVGSDALGVKADIIAGNHAMDDLMLSYYLHSMGQAHLDPYESEHRYKNTVQAVITYYGLNYNSVVEDIFTNLDVWLKEGGVIVINDYPSWHEKNYAMLYWYEYRKKFLDCLNQKFLRSGYHRYPLQSNNPYFALVYGWKKHVR